MYFCFFYSCHLVICWKLLYYFNSNKHLAALPKIYDDFGRRGPSNIVVRPLKPALTTQIKNQFDSVSV